VGGHALGPVEFDATEKGDVRGMRWE